MKYILVIGDGMADEPIPALDGKTPLQHAATPAMDEIASAGVIGTVLTVPKGLPAGSDVAILSIFGCDPLECYTGRAPLEAASIGIKLVPGNVAYRCNMVTFEDEDIPFEEKRILSHSAGSIEGELSVALVRELFDTPGFKEAAIESGISIYPTLSFRHIAVQHKADIFGLELIPPHDNLGKKVGTLLPRGGDNAGVLEDLMRKAHLILDSHPVNIARRKEGKLPANGIWFWAEGTVVELPSFSDKHGKTGGVVSAVPLCQGIGMLIGLERIIVQGATGELHTNYEGKVDAVLELLKTHDFATIHIEAPDECSHDGDLAGKLQAIEWIDSRVLAPLMQQLREEYIDFRLLLMSDHRTLLVTRGHDGDPVPYAIYDSRYDRKTGVCFSEVYAKQGEYIPVGTDLISKLFED